MGYRIYARANKGSFYAWRTFQSSEATYQDPERIAGRKFARLNRPLTVMRLLALGIKKSLFRW